MRDYEHDLFAGDRGGRRALRADNAGQQNEREQTMDSHGRETIYQWAIHERALLGEG
jgi:hypothetical protein